jgi:hypothetical protein
MMRYLWHNHIVEIVLEPAITLCGVKIVEQGKGRLAVGTRTIVELKDLMEVREIK